MSYFIVKKRDGDFVDLFDLETGRLIRGKLLPQKQIAIPPLNIGGILQENFKPTKFSSEGRKLVSEDGKLLCDISDKMEPLENMNDIEDGSVLYIY